MNQKLQSGISRYNWSVFNLTLTFDNGPDPDTTPVVQDPLERVNIRNTFFVLGAISLNRKPT